MTIPAIQSARSKNAAVENTIARCAKIRLIAIFSGENL